MKFSVRKGYKKANTIVQKDSMNDELRNSLWSVLVRNRFGNISFMQGTLLNNSMARFCDSLWFNLFKLPVDSIPDNKYTALEYLNSQFFQWQWNEVYDFIEFAVQYFKDQGLTEQINFVLIRELSGYRFIDNILTDIIDSQEIEMLQDALTNEDFPGVNKHLKRALELMNDRKSPDYRNSIKESISAVESMANYITKKSDSTLGSALKTIERTHEIHPALEQGFLKIYGYTSDEGGIRHSMMDEPELHYDDSKFFLISCTAFINYLKSKIK